MDSNKKLKQAAQLALEWFDIVESVDRHKWPDWGPVKDALLSALSHPELSPLWPQDETDKTFK